MSAPVVDGRRARRDRNRATALDCAIEMFSEESLLPSIEAVARRAGVSLRSMYRYFGDADGLVQAAIERSMADALRHARIPRVGDGPLTERIDAFVDVRVRLHDRIEATFRATVHHAPRNPHLRIALSDTRTMLREQLERQFAPELDPMDPTTRARTVQVADALTQFDAIDLLRRHRRLGSDATGAALRFGLTALLSAR